MAVSYKKLWKLLIDHNMKKKDLARVADISNYTITKMSKDENVTVETLGKICAALNCGVNDIMEFVPEEPPTLSELLPEATDEAGVALIRNRQEEVRNKRRIRRHKK